MTELQQLSWTEKINSNGRKMLISDCDSSDIKICENWKIIVKKSGILWQLLIMTFYTRQWCTFVLWTDETVQFFNEMFTDKLQKVVEDFSKSPEVIQN